MAAAGADWGQSLDCFYKVSCLGLGHSSTTNGLKLDLRLTSERYAQFSNKSCGDLLDQPGFKAIHDAILKHIGFFENFYMFVQKLLWFFAVLTIIGKAILYTKTF